MKRKDFLKNTLIGSSLLVVSKSLGNQIHHQNDEIFEPNPEQIIGFNHIQNTNSKIMNNMIIHRADSRGSANHGWLNAKHSFSFANYYNPERMNFGTLRVLNDDQIAEGMGFGTHPHDNMEIITIPLHGAIEHKDSMGNSSVIKAGEIQVMSAGTGIQHSEFNHNKDQSLQLLQIWIFPNKQNVTPRYDQLALDPTSKQNQFTQILSPDPNDAGVWIHQNAWFHLGQFDKDKTSKYQLKDKSNGIYAFVIKGKFAVENQDLSTRDAIGIWNQDQISVKSTSDNAEMLIIEVPMT
ncbi:MAG: pirin family protein [Chitinophagales bacterium]